MHKVKTMDGGLLANKIERSNEWNVLVVLLLSPPSFFSSGF